MGPRRSTVYTVRNTNVVTSIVNVSFALIFIFLIRICLIFLVNRFAGTRLEDLQGEIASLCKDQHGCRYLQKKLEEGVAEHRDMIFRETFSHFAELMTGEFHSVNSFRR